MLVDPILVVCLPGHNVIKCISCILRLEKYKRWAIIFAFRFCEFSEAIFFYFYILVDLFVVPLILLGFPKEETFF